MITMKSFYSDKILTFAAPLPPKCKEIEDLFLKYVHLFSHSMFYSVLFNTNCKPIIKIIVNQCHISNHLLIKYLDIMGQNN
jgi:hypothetical protein